MEQQEQPEAGQTQGEHPTVLKNETPNFIYEGVGITLGFLQAYGWFIVLALVALVFLRSKLETYLAPRRKKKEQEGIIYDGDTARARQEQMDVARTRMQELHDAKAALYAEKQKERDEAKLQEKIEDWERHKEGKGYRSKWRPDENTDKDKPPAQTRPRSARPQYRPDDYSPLMGPGGGGYRPARRGGASGGG